MARYKTVIGRAEMLDLPELFLVDVPAKTDTGAYFSAIHATNITEKTVGKKKVLSFTLLDKHPTYEFSRDMQSSSYNVRTIENSFGQKEERYVVNLKVRLGGKKFTAAFTLADRSVKSFPVLLGRELLNRRFIVDTSITNISKKPLKQKLKKWMERNSNPDEDMLV